MSLKNDSIATQIFVKLNTFIELKDKPGLSNYILGKTNEYPSYNLLHNNIIGNKFYEENFRIILQKIILLLVNDNDIEETR